jgi:hypothetical protein
MSDYAQSELLDKEHGRRLFIIPVFTGWNRFVPLQLLGQSVSCPPTQNREEAQNSDVHGATTFVQAVDQSRLT